MSNILFSVKGKIIRFINIRRVGKQKNTCICFCVSACIFMYVHHVVRECGESVRAEIKVKFMFFHVWLFLNAATHKNEKKLWNVKVCIEWHNLKAHNHVKLIWSMQGFFLFYFEYFSLSFCLCQFLIQMFWNTHGDLQSKVLSQLEKKTKHIKITE